MKSNTRTVLDTTITSASSYSSGPLDVGDLHELAVDLHITAVTYTSGSLCMEFSRIDAAGNVHSLGTTSDITSVRDVTADIGSSVSNSQIQRAFGDQIQLDLIASTGNSISAYISVKGK
jgi:hypothetical protein